MQQRPKGDQPAQELVLCHAAQPPGKIVPVTNRHLHILSQELDPYYPFEEAVDVWARTFAALGINYKVNTKFLINVLFLC